MVTVEKGGINHTKMHLHQGHKKEETSGHLCLFFFIIKKSRCGINVCIHTCIIAKHATRHHKITAKMLVLSLPIRTNLSSLCGEVSTVFL